MKLIKMIFIFLILMMMGILISFADTKSKNEYNELIQTFINTEAKFNFYNIKANGSINYNISKEEMVDMCTEILNNLGLEESDLAWEEIWNKDEKQIHLTGKIEDESISIIFIKKNAEEAHIMVDILQNKVYKNIVGVYTVLENTLEKFAINADINTCISGEYSKKLHLSKCNDILTKILYNMNAQEVDRIQEENFISVTADSKILQENDLEYLGNNINLNIGMRYSEDEDKTLIYLATPIIKLDY
ncbi:YwmB family TATA-box binding protein [Romboutsia sp. 1001713B170131_170501_G6]|uniref:YwmB family TATA-box binding protein n=1 Tax=Romboutsia sp. 1001713B170131_170501_G6 TaxID=2787108 RepID=UPI0018AA9511|nr:YwmB family TATA-box binding protein [Romboutsia sp. 1001713B170131_170501_G6]